MVRAVYLGLFLVLALGAGIIYYGNTRETTAVVANGDLQVGSAITDSSVSLRRVHPGSIPAGSARQLSDVVGKFVAWPILDGQFVPLKALARDRASLIAGGLAVPSGFHAISVPVTAADAVGGALRPGDYVDVLVVAKNQLAGATPQPANILGKHVLVLGLRTDQGQALDTSGGSAGTVRGLNFGNQRLASIVLAVDPDDEARYVGAEAVDTFSVVLNLQ
jgi:Flp pilus assembly protein CpaB